MCGCACASEADLRPTLPLVKVACVCGLGSAAWPPRGRRATAATPLLRQLAGLAPQEVAAHALVCRQLRPKQVPPKTAAGRRPGQTERLPTQAPAVRAPHRGTEPPKLVLSPTAAAQHFQRAKRLVQQEVAMRMRVRHTLRPKQALLRTAAGKRPAHQEANCQTRTARLAPHGVAKQASTQLQRPRARAQQLRLPHRWGTRLRTGTPPEACCHTRASTCGAGVVWAREA